MLTTASPEFSAVHAEILSRAIVSAGNERELESAMKMHQSHLVAADVSRMNKEYIDRLAQLRGFK